MFAETHRTRYFIHLGSTKLYRDLEQLYCLSGMIQDIEKFLVKYQNFQQVNYKHQRPTKLLQHMPILELKWERTAMDFVVGVPKTLGKSYSI